MKKIISFVGLFAVLGVGIGDAHGVAMSAQVRRLLQEKQEKIEQLEKCEGKKQGWMIAGISTIGLTAVGVGVNIAQASKSNRLSSEIEMEKSTLERHENELNRINSQISELQAQQKNGCCDKRDRCCKCGDMRDGNCPDGNDEEGDLTTYSDYVLSCKMTMFTFRTGQVRDDLVDALNKACYEVTKQYMERTETNDFVKYECKDYREKANCYKQQNDKECPDITYSYAWPLPEPYLSKIKAKLAEYESKCVAQGGNFEYVQATTGTGEIAIGGGKAVCKNRTRCDANEEVVVHIDVDTGVEPVTPVTPVKPDQKKSEKQTECKEGYVRIGGKGACVKADYIIAHGYANAMCKCKDGSTNCKLEKDEKGLSVCQYEKGEGEKCSCVEPKKDTECKEGYVRIGGKGECVKRDYSLWNSKCKCKDGTENCGLREDTGGSFVCQTSKGWGVKCVCEDCPKGEEFDDGVKGCVVPCVGVKLRGVCLPSTYASAVYNFKNKCTRQISAHYTCADKNDIAGICSYLGGVTKVVTDRYYCDCPDTSNDCKKVFRVY